MARGTLKIIALLLLTMLAGAACERTTHTTTTNISINVDGVRCFFIILPDGGKVEASNVRDNGNGTYNIGNRTYNIDQNCEASPVTTTNPRPGG